MIRYEITFPEDIHWERMWSKIEKDHGSIKYPFDIDGFLRKYRGKVFMDDRYEMLSVIRGIEFKSEEDLVVFKLTFC